MMRVVARSSSTNQVGVLARFAYGYVRNQIDSVVALARVLRGENRQSSDSRKEERW
jgi:hypothetical protein